MPRVIHGEGEASLMGLPTANVELECEKGVYLCETNYGHGLAICAFENGVEVHLFGFEGSLYGKNLEIKRMKPINKKRILEVALLINE
jgi:FAD synthase